MTLTPSRNNGVTPTLPESGTRQRSKMVMGARLGDLSAPSMGKWWGLPLPHVFQSIIIYRD